MSTPCHFPENELLVWRIILPEFLEKCDECYSILATDEQIRAAKFLFKKDRERFIIAHWALRCILANIGNVIPNSLQFTRNFYGKPELVGKCLNNPIGFNLSHSGDIALVVVSHIVDIGIDVEQVHAEISYEDIVSQHFTAQESSFLYSIPISQRRERFFQIWNGKEAFIKARGLGLSIPLNTFSAIPRLDTSQYLLETHDQPEDAEDWSILSLQLFPGYTAAVAVKGKSISLKHFQFH